MRIFLLTCIFLAAIFQPVFAAREININIPEYSLVLTDNGQKLKVYDIAVGTPYEQTPVGNYKIYAKEKNPIWLPGSKFLDKNPVPPGPDNPLGTRWMEFAPAYGIHGTNKGWDINYPVSGGCIRMQDRDAQELYELVNIGTPVIIIYETMFLIEKPDGLYLKLLPDIYRRNTNIQERFVLKYQPFAAKYILQNFIFPGEPEFRTFYEQKIAIPKVQR